MKSNKTHYTTGISGRVGTFPERRRHFWSGLQLQSRQDRDLHFQVTDSRHFVCRVVPDLLRARFFGQKVTIALGTVDVDLFLRGIGPLGRAVLRLADTITVPSIRMSHKLAAFDIKATPKEPTVDLHGVAARLITEVQPRLLVYSSPEWRQDSAVILSAFELIQRKYPRAELTLAGPDLTLQTLVPNPILRDRLHFAQPCRHDEFVELCRSHDIFLATTRSDMTPLQVVLAMASGLPAIMPPVGDVRPATELALLRSGPDRRFVRGRIVETVLSLVENKELAAAMSLYSRQMWPVAPAGSPLRPPWRLVG
jgi:glycosyltransferase involved in cell wall biosynthesis